LWKRKRKTLKPEGGNKFIFILMNRKDEGTKKGHREEEYIED
jgi:hypothetical protein